MDPEIEEIIKKQMEKLPAEVKKFFINSELSNRITNIGKKNGLTPVQIEILQTETNLVMLGLAHPSDYQEELENRLNANDFKIDSIMNDVNREILGGIREKLKELYEREEKTPEVEPNSLQQNLNFILSGGKTPALTEKKGLPDSTDSINNLKANTQTASPKTDDVKVKLIL
jgi:hypothetical protein